LRGRIHSVPRADTASRGKTTRQMPGKGFRVGQILQTTAPGPEDPRERRSHPRPVEEKIGPSVNGDEAGKVKGRREGSKAASSTPPEKLALKRENLLR